MWFRPGVQFVRMSLGLVVTLLGAAGCTPAPDQAKHSVNEYREDAKLRSLQIARCFSDPNSNSISLDCRNAREAGRLEDVGSLRDLPPLKLPQPGTPANSPPPASDRRN